MHRTTSRFWKCFENLPITVQKLSKKNFELLKTSPLHPSLHFKEVGKFWSVRVGINHRALSIKDGEDFIWVWIGTHSEYEQLIKKYANNVLPLFRSLHSSRQALSLGCNKMKYKKLILLFTGILIFFITALPITLRADEAQNHNYKPEEGYVPDEETAIKIAIAVWIPIYGKKQIEGEKPYQAVLKDGIWYVTGSLPEGWLGGVAEAEIAKDDGRILRISHGK